MRELILMRKMWLFPAPWRNENHVAEVFLDGAFAHVAHPAVHLERQAADFIRSF